MDKAITCFYVFRRLVFVALSIVALGVIILDLSTLTGLVTFTCPRVFIYWCQGYTSCVALNEVLYK